MVARSPERVAVEDGWSVSFLESSMDKAFYQCLEAQGIT